MRLKSSADSLGTMPAEPPAPPTPLPSPVLSSECVLPEPVVPYAMMQPCAPQSADSSTGRATRR